MTGQADLSGGTVALNGGALGAGGGVEVASGGLLSGYGTVTGDVGNAGEVDASGAQTLGVVGAYVQTGGVTNVESASTLSVTAGLDQQGGVLNLLGAFMHVENGYTVENGATLVANGTITADFVNAGLLEFAGPGTTGVGFASDSANGILGNFTQTATGTLIVTIDDYGNPDTLSVAGWATLGGTLSVGLADGYTPQPGDDYFVMHGMSSGAVRHPEFPDREQRLFPDRIRPVRDGLHARIPGQFLTSATRSRAVQYIFNIGTTCVCGSPPVTWTWRSLSMYTLTSLRTPNSGR